MSSKMEDYDSNEISLDENQTFPLEIILVIFSFLDSLNLSKSRLVCKEWKIIADSESLWKSLVKKDFKYCRLSSKDQQDSSVWRNAYKRMYGHKPVNRILVSDVKLYTINPDGSDKVIFVEITPPPKSSPPLDVVESLLSDGRISQYQQPTWSPFGDVAVTKMDRRKRKNSIAVLNARGEVLHEIFTRSVPFYIYWSPDGSRFSLLSNGPMTIILSVVDLEDETIEERIVDEGRPYFYSWSPDITGRLVAHKSSKVLAYVDASKGREGIKDILLPRDNSSYTSPFWMRNQKGEMEIFHAIEGNSSDTKASTDLVVCKIVDPFSDHNVQNMNLSELEVYCISQGLSTQGCDDYKSFLSMIKNKSEEGHPFLDRKYLLKDDVGFLLFVPSPNTRMVAYQVSSSTNLKLIDRDKMDRDPMYSPIVVDDRAMGFYWSPDSRYLLFLRSSGSFQFTWGIHDTVLERQYFLTDFHPTDTFLDNYLPFMSQYAQNTSFFSPDSNSFVYCDNSGEYPQVNVCGVEEGSTPKTIGTGKFATWSPL